MAYPAARQTGRRLRRYCAVSGYQSQSGAYSGDPGDVFRPFFFVVAAYIVLFFVLDPLPDNYAEGESVPSSSELLDIVDAQLAEGEHRLRQMERYVTSDSFSLRSRFRQL